MDGEKPNRRPFATGSKPGPDEIDKYLEERGFYRKHIARDGSSLFRVIAEQLFDIQNYHDQVRQDIANYMELNIRDYANEVDKNFYNYVSILRRSRTHGTLLELRVIARMYRRNIILYEPNANNEVISRDFVMEDDYKSKLPLRIFYSHKDKHFDSVYTLDTVERYAECQAIVYEILYMYVYQLPDVQYAVERMLHDMEEETTLPLEDDSTKYRNASGEIFSFDSHENTNCVLKDPRTCHFHNQEDFEEVVEENKDAITIINRSDDPGKLKIFKPIDGFLYKKDKSCVRQLLDEKITPFPYKVAKALDPSIYRNTEFELWSENRKEQRLKWFDANGLPLKENDDNRYWSYYGDKGRNEPFGIPKYTYFDSTMIDQDNFIIPQDDPKKKYILGELTGLDHFHPHKGNFDHFQPQKGNFENFQPPKESLEQIVMPANIQHHHPNRNFRNNRRNRGGFHHNNTNNTGPNHHYNNNNHGHHHHHHQQPNMNHNVNYVGDIERENFQYTEQEQIYSPQQQQQQQTVYQELPGNYQYYQYDQSSPPHAYYQNNPPPGQYPYMPPSPYQQSMPGVPYQGQMMSYPAYHQPAIIYPAGPAPNAQATNPAIQSANNSVTSNTGPVQNNNNNESTRDLLNLIRDAELLLPVNWAPIESNDPNGSDLPMNEMQTLQFYYNLGVRYYMASGITRRLENVASQQDQNVGVEQNANVRVETLPPPVPVNTPVTTKPPGNPTSSGHRYHQQNNNNNNRRVFNSQTSSHGQGSKDNNNKPRGHQQQQQQPQQHNQQRKEIQFNSNVKNVHKVDHNKSNSSQVSGNVSATTSTNNLERTSSVMTAAVGRAMSNLQISPIKQQQQDSQNNSSAETSSVTQNQSQQSQQQQQAVPVQAQSPYYQQYPQYPPQNIIPQPAQSYLYYQMDSGELMPVAPAPIQPFYYGYPTPQTPVYYHPQQPHMYNGDMSTMSSSDSGILETSAYAAYAQQPNYPYYYQPTTPIYYPPTPLIPTPHVTQQLAPVYPAVISQEVVPDAAAATSPGNYNNEGQQGNGAQK